MKVIVTGVTGFIGAELAKELITRGHEVYGIVRHCVNRDNAVLGYIGDELNVIDADITDIHSIETAFRKINPDAVIHLAAFSPVRKSFTLPMEAMRSHFEGTANIAYTLIRMESKARMVLASTAEVYGIQPEDKPFTEDLPLHPSSPYAVAKASVDMFMRMLFRVYDFNGVALRCINTFGRRFDMGFFTEYLITKMLKNEEIYIGAPDHVRDYMYVTEQVEAYILAMEKEDARGQVLNIGVGQGYTNLEWCNKIADIIGYDKSKIHAGEYPPGYPVRPLASDQPYLVLDASRAKEVLGWNQITGVNRGVRKTIEFVQAKLT